MSTTDPNDLRDARLDAAWRAVSREEPSPDLDDAIRAAARREVGAGPQPADARSSKVPSALRPESGWAPLAAAATIGAIAIGLLQLWNQEKVGAPGSEKAFVSDMPTAPVKSKLRDESAREVTAPSYIASASTSTAEPTKEASSGALPERAAPPPPVSAPAALPPTSQRKDAGASVAVEQRATTNASALTREAPAVGSRHDAPTDAAKPAAPVAEPFPADDMKREAKLTPAPSLSLPAEAGGAGIASGTLSGAPAPVVRDETPRDAQSSTSPVAQYAAPGSSTPMRRLQGGDVARAPMKHAEAASAVAGATSDMRAKALPKLPVPDWVALIRKLRDEGKTDEAAKELAAFRNAYADHERLLPQDLRDWKPETR